jgi:hypothetical protein
MLTLPKYFNQKQFKQMLIPHYAPEGDGGGGGGGEPQHYSKEDVDTLVAAAVKAVKEETVADFTKKLEALKKESIEHRMDSKVLRETLAEVLGLTKEELPKETDLLKNAIAEIGKANKELAEKFEKSEREKEQLKKEALLKDTADKLGLDTKLALKLANLDAEDMEAELKALQEEFPALKKQPTPVGMGTNPPRGNGKPGLEEEYKTLLAKPKLTGSEQQRLNEIVLELSQNKILDRLKAKGRI